MPKVQDTDAQGTLSIKPRRNLWCMGGRMIYILLLPLFLVAVGCIAASLAYLIATLLGKGD